MLLMLVDYYVCARISTVLCELDFKEVSMQNYLY